MDIEKLIDTLKQHGVSCVRSYGKYCSICDEAATALSTLQAENKKLRAEVESLKKGHCAGCSIPAVKAEQIRDLTDAPKLRAELEQKTKAAQKYQEEWYGAVATCTELRAELEKVKAERDAAIKELYRVSYSVGNLVDFIDDKIYKLIPYDMYTALKNNTYAITMWMHEPEWSRQKED